MWNLSESPPLDRFQTTDNERDAETGLDYRMARYYDAEYGRFLAVDPLAGQFPGWSPYNYVMGDPVDRYGWVIEYMIDELYLTRLQMVCTDMLKDELTIIPKNE